MLLMLLLLLPLFLFGVWCLVFAACCLLLPVKPPLAVSDCHLVVRREKIRITYLVAISFCSTARSASLKMRVTVGSPLNDCGVNPMRRTSSANTTQ